MLFRVSFMLSKSNWKPAKKVKSSRGVPWLNRNLFRMRTDTRKFFNRAKQIRNWQRCKSVLMTYSNVSREAKWNSFRELWEEIEETIGVSRVYKAVAKNKTISSLYLKTEGETFTENVEYRVHLLHRTHFPKSYHTADGNSILPDTTITDRRGKWWIGS